MKNIFCGTFTGLLFIAALGYLAAGCSRNEQIPASTEDFLVAADSLGYEIVVPGLDETDIELGILEYALAEKETGNGPFHIHFHVLKDVAAARRLFDIMYDYFQSETSYLIEYGSPNRSGAFGNTQDFYFANVGKSRRLIRVENTLAFSVAETHSQDTEVRELFSAIGYTFTQDR